MVENLDFTEEQKAFKKKIQGFAICTYLYLSSWPFILQSSVFLLVYNAQIFGLLHL